MYVFITLPKGGTSRRPFIFLDPARSNDEE